MVLIRYNSRHKKGGYFELLSFVGGGSLPDPALSSFQRTSIAFGRTGASPIPVNAGHQGPSPGGETADRRTRRTPSNPASQRRGIGQSPGYRRFRPPPAWRSGSPRGPGLSKLQR